MMSSDYLVVLLLISSAAVPRENHSALPATFVVFVLQQTLSYVEVPWSMLSLQSVQLISTMKVEVIHHESVKPEERT